MLINSSEKRNLIFGLSTETEDLMDKQANPRDSKQIAFFLRDLEGGGAERAIISLAGEIAKQGHQVDLVVGDAASEYRAEVLPEVNVVDFGVRSPLQELFCLIGYLRRQKPAVVMSALDLANIMLIMAAKISCYKGRTVLSQRAVVDASLRELGRARRFLTKQLMRICFPRADAVVSNSNAAAIEVCARLGVSAERIVTIQNALNLERINRLAAEPVNILPFVNTFAPLLITVGSLTKRKDMETLIRAIALVRAQKEVNLLIIGKGEEQSNIEAMIAAFGLGGNILLLGFDVNPYKWMAAATIFVSSSTEEGFPNVIAEALALGRSIVATDCPGDTAELLGHGKWGTLVPVGDPERMAQGILDTLENSDSSDSRVRAADFSPANNTTAYLKVLLQDVTPSVSPFQQSV